MKYSMSGSGHGATRLKHIKPHGDLPELSADAYGNVNDPVRTDKLTLTGVRGRLIMIHKHSETHSGGGMRAIV
jgi:Cu/Zn superoxide dismutase